MLAHAVGGVFALSQSMKTYFKGFKAEYTGKVVNLHGGAFYELLILEGFLKGQTKVTQVAPKAGE